MGEYNFLEDSPRVTQIEVNKYENAISYFKAAEVKFESRPFEGKNGMGALSVTWIFKILYQDKYVAAILKFTQPALIRDYKKTTVESMKLFLRKSFDLGKLIFLRDAKEAGFEDIIVEEVQPKELELLSQETLETLLGGQ